jgi:hypothetical protein
MVAVAFQNTFHLKIHQNNIFFKKKIVKNSTHYERLNQYICKKKRGFNRKIKKVYLPYHDPNLILKRSVIVPCK